ncbi:hypothetical protein [Streptomyces sp. 184]|uniref:hypothetical protein n=1 Tax=Streptomyces sp. 184 TaxID=1827526 RepID=UPI0038929991
MSGARRVWTAVAAALLGALTVLLLCRFTVADPAYYTGAVREADGYQRVYDEVLPDPAVRRALRTGALGIPLRSDAVVDNLPLLVPRPALEQAADRQARALVAALTGTGRTAPGDDWRGPVAESATEAGSDQLRALRADADPVAARGLTHLIARLREYVAPARAAATPTSALRSAVADFVHGTWPPGAARRIMRALDEVLPAGGPGEGAPAAADGGAGAGGGAEARPPLVARGSVAGRPGVRLVAPEAEVPGGHEGPWRPPLVAPGGGAGDGRGAVGTDGGLQAAGEVRVPLVTEAQGGGEGAVEGEGGGGSAAGPAGAASAAASSKLPGWVPARGAVVRIALAASASWWAVAAVAAAAAGAGALALRAAVRGGRPRARTAAAACAGAAVLTAAAGAAVWATLPASAMLVPDGLPPSVSALLTDVVTGLYRKAALTWSAALLTLTLAATALALTASTATREALRRALAALAAPAGDPARAASPPATAAPPRPPAPEPASGLPAAPPPPARTGPSASAAKGAHPRRPRGAASAPGRVGSRRLRRPGADAPAFPRSPALPPRTRRAPPGPTRSRHPRRPGAGAAPPAPPAFRRPPAARPAHRTPPPADSPAPTPALASAPAPDPAPGPAPAPAPAPGATQPARVPALTPRALRSRRVRRFGVAAALVAAIAQVWVLVGVPSADALACNGDIALCDRPYDRVVQVGSHNAMATVPDGFLGAHQDVSLTAQLDRGARALLLDTHYWETAERLVPPAGTGGLDAAERATLVRAVDSVVRPRPGTWLCHGPCRMGATSLAAQLRELRGWLEAHPRDVVTLIVQDAITPADTARAFRAAGLGPYLHRPGPDPAAPWPTLGEMADSGRRLVVFAEEADGPASWYRNFYDYAVETPYRARTAGDLSCAPHRGGSDSRKRLFLLNHFVTHGMGAPRAEAAAVNDADVIVRRARTCALLRGRMPTIVAVNHMTLGDAVGAVRRLNAETP